MVFEKIMLYLLFNFKTRESLFDDFDFLLDFVDLFFYYKIVLIM